MPVDVYVNYYARRDLLKAIEKRTKAQFNAICKQNGYAMNVPTEVVEAFDERLSSIKAEVEAKKVAGVKMLTLRSQNKKNKIESPKVNTMNAVREMGW